MQSKGYEVVGMMPYGLVYFVSKDRKVNSVEKLAGKKYAVLAVDPTQRRMAQRIGMNAIDVSYDDVAGRFVKVSLT